MRPLRRVLVLLCLAAALLPFAPAEAAGSRVAVLYFENQGNPDLDMLKLGLAQMLISDLAGTPGLEIIERTRLNEVLGELDLQKTDKVDSSSVAELGRVLGVDRLVLGHYFYFEPVDSLVVGARVVEVETGRIVGAEQTQGTRQEFFALEKRIAERLLPHLGIEAKDGEPPPAPVESESAKPGKKEKAAPGGRVRGKPSASGGAAPQQAESVATQEPDAAGGSESADESAVAPRPQPVDPLGAALAFSEGLDHLDRKDVRRAQDALRRAVALDPGLEDARVALASIQL